jgi:hypothetical protein
MNRLSFPIGVIGATAAQRFDPGLAIGSTGIITFDLLIQGRTSKIKNLWRNGRTE